MNTSLKDLLDEVLQSNKPQTLHPLEKAMYGPSWVKSQSGKKFLEALYLQDKYLVFENYLQLLGNSSSVTTIENLADWIVKRARNVGSKQTIAEVDSYLISSEVEVYVLMLLASIHIDSEYSFSNGTKLIQASSIPNKFLASEIVQNSFNSVLPSPKVESVLIAPYKQPVFHKKDTDFETETPRLKIPFQDLEDTRLCLALVILGIHSIGYGTVAPDNMPFIHSVSGWNVPFYKQPRSSPSVIEIEMKIADRILKKFNGISDIRKEKLKISINKLNGYSSGASPVEKAIDLRTCLESLFLSDGNKEQLRHTLSVRAALFLGETLDERKEILKLIKKVYDVTSTAVHTGKLPKKNVNLLPKAASLARKAIIKLIEEGEVDWQEIELKV